MSDFAFDTGSVFLSAMVSVETSAAAELLWRGFKKNIGLVVRDFKQSNIISHLFNDISHLILKITISIIYQTKRKHRVIARFFRQNHYKIEGLSGMMFSYRLSSRMISKSKDMVSVRTRI